jgi:lipoprotein-anchoring transpeptidase ErfK/SrfK
MTALLSRCATACTVAAALASTTTGAEQRSSKPSPTPAVRPDMLAVQVLLDRAGFSPGEIDGYGGTNTQGAIDAYERETGAAVADRAASAAEPPTIRYTITAEDAAAPLVTSIPEDMMAKARLARLGYTSRLEMIAERFHASPALLKRLNPRLQLAVGEDVEVPNVNVVSAAKGEPLPGIVVRVSRQSSNLTVHDATGRVILYAPVTSGSEHDPLPLGSWSVTGIARNPSFNYSPNLFWDADPSHAKAKIPPGPNNPVGLVWIDIDKPHYGLHGTPEPGAVGHTTSHGCVRLTNWDALRLAAILGKGTQVEFTE